MISREDFVFCIGYDGDTAIVDAKAKKEFGRLSTMELAEKGLYRAAFASALYSEKPEEMQSFIEFFNKKPALNIQRQASFRGSSGFISNRSRR
jgi:hypothetical protein